MAAWSKSEAFDCCLCCEMETDVLTAWGCWTANAWMHWASCVIKCKETILVKLGK